jgi:Delta24-sterol reductase
MVNLCKPCSTVCSLLLSPLILILKKTLVKFIVTDHRWIVVCLFLLPLSFLFDLYWHIRNIIIFRFGKSSLNHEAKVKGIQEQLKNADPKKKLCTSRSGWMTMNVSEASYKQSDDYNRINLLPLLDIINVDTKKKTIFCEPNVSCGQLTACLNPLGWTLKILPELDDLTVGGLVSGTGIETSSHKYGLMQHICVSFEIVLNDGTLVRASKDENKELFDAIPWSYGTIGFVVGVELEIIPCKQYVHLKYIPCKSMKECEDLLIKEAGGKHEFIEALVYSRDSAVVMTGDFTDEPQSDKINSIGNYYKPWFYKHVETFLNKKGEEFIPLRHYYHRHTKSIFWEMQDILPFGNHPVFRYLFGWLVPPKVSFLKLTQTKEIHDLYKNHHVVQDMLVPLNILEQSIEVFEREWKVYPLWVCPFALPKSTNGLLTNKTDQEMWVDIGAYGTPKVKNFETKSSHRKVEKYVRDVKGFQMLYADTYMNREEFREMFDHELYDKMREKYNCEKSFDDVFGKVSQRI